ncbi:protein HflC [Agarivorans sp. OAG1]|uniref:Protein HflC n=1 Tax=Agarivorans albus MKT 106 TaxID=1331007 RepID=R9PRS4_AGAAL|nr:MULTISPECIES: protease modulator HflC [Agarivorans]MPW31408.1 protease modulator HflC [Agarivorans sp. B2Z047]UQN42451.1 protease modulator HflC [Agarivorans sp. B2Z047]BEU01727.1 protein HflC [Agarivorans sp. OAG1]GAD03978.1 hflC protein [Agarivorans albus MKT 106]
MKQLAIFGIILALLVGYSSVFVVNEGERGIVIQFGKVKRTADGATKVYPPGLQFKVPFIDSVRTLDARIQTLDGNADRFVTSEKKDLIIDSYVKWRIADFSQFYLSTGGSVLQAESLLTRKINNGLRSEIGARTIRDIVSGERGQVMEDALKRMARSSEIGIEVTDVRIKQINLPDEVSSSIYQRMRAERLAVAKEHRSQGQEQAEIIRANVDRRVNVLLADADKRGREMRGEGDATAAKIYADAYTKNPEFYKFWRSLMAYRTSFDNGGDVMVLEPDSEFFRYMKEPAKQ